MYIFRNVGRNLSKYVSIRFGGKLHDIQVDSYDIQGEGVRFVDV